MTGVAQTTVPVSGAGHQPYDVLIGAGLTGAMVSRIPTEVRKILITHPPVLHARAEALRETLAEGAEVFLAEIPDGEGAKRAEVASFLWGLLGQLEFGRTDLIIGFGGGATTDLAGFVAATWLRGIRVIHIPTTVLGMVDAAVGGKTGINTAEGKNLVGSFHAPTLVVADTDYLTTLPENDIRSGLAEVIKCGFISDTGILDLVEGNPTQVVTPGSSELTEVIRRAITVKAQVVSQDFKESGLREVLNYGHTLGHAIEHAERYKWRHGAAISIGMVFAAELSSIVAGLDEASVLRHRTLLSSLGLPVEYPAGRWQTLLATMQRDKKSRQGVLRFVVLDSLGSARVLAIPDESVLFAAYEQMLQA
jgi:3-dehydroquinate synthase